jgi:hypothetical protein
MYLYDYSRYSMYSTYLCWHATGTSIAMADLLNTAAVGADPRSAM